MKQEVVILGGQTLDQSMTSWSSSIKNWFYKLIVCIIKKKMSWCETEMQKYMPLVKSILGGQRIDQKRSKGWWRGSRERIEMEAQKVTELTIEEEHKEHLHLPLLVSSRCVSTELPIRFRSKALQQ